MSWPEHLGHAFTIPVHPGRAVLAQNAHRRARQVPREKLAALFQYGTYETMPYQPNIYRVTLDGWYARARPRTEKATRQAAHDVAWTMRAREGHRARHVSAAREERRCPMTDLLRKAARDHDRKVTRGAGETALTNLSSLKLAWRLEDRAAGRASLDDYT